MNYVATSMASHNAEGQLHREWITFQCEVNARYIEAYATALRLVGRKQTIFVYGASSPFAPLATTQG
jgi:hypothetical protein